MILYAFTSSSYALGTEGDDGLRASLEKRAGGIPVMFTCGAALEALRFVGARRIALVHPPWFSDDISRKGMEYFRARGMEVLYCDRMAPARAFTEVPPAEVYEWVGAKVSPQAEAVFIGGNGLRAIGVIHALEQRLHRPVLTANQVLFWQALRTLRVSSRPNGYGVLFKNSGTAR
jgi:maleate isomerase